MANDPLRNAGLLVSVICVAGLGGYAHAQTTFLEEGFTLEVVTDDVPLARQIAEAPDGTLFVGSSSNCNRLSNVYAVVKTDDGDVEVVEIDEDLRCPSGVALRGNDLYVAALNRVLRYRNIMETYRNSPSPDVITASLPSATHHGWKYLVFGPDGYLYVPVGAPCNICERSDERYSTILRMDPDSGETTVYAHGVRNSVGLAMHPVTREIWFSENGRDWSGDDLPADEINRVQTPGSHYGFPYFHQDHRPDAESVDFEDPVFGAGRNPDDYLRSEHLIQAHSAALGVTFYTGNQFPSHYCGALFIAEHGSWNRTEGAGKVGYRVSVLRFANTDDPSGANANYDPFIEWQVQKTQRSHTGRPNDVVVSRDGSLLISDDDPAGIARGAIYRVRYTPPDGDTTPTGCADTAHIPTFAPKSHETRQGFARVVNHGETTATIEMEAFNDAGQRHGPVTLTLEAGHAQHFNSTDLEDGNEDKGLSEASGPAPAIGVSNCAATAWKCSPTCSPETASSPACTTPRPTRARDRHRQRRRGALLRISLRRADLQPGPQHQPGEHAAPRQSRRPRRRRRDHGHRQPRGVRRERGGAHTGRGGVALYIRRKPGIRGRSRRRTGTRHRHRKVAPGGGVGSAHPGCEPAREPNRAFDQPVHRAGQQDLRGHVDHALRSAVPCPRRRQRSPGFVRIINRGNMDGSVEIGVQDDTNGDFETLTLPLQANQSVHFNSEHLETGEGADWTDGIGDGQGDWRLTLSSELDLDVLAYIRRTSDGFLTSMHDFVRRTGTDTYEVAFFNPGKNPDQVSHLRILNTGALDAPVSISGTDSAGGPSAGTVVLTVPAGTARSFSSQELEAGHDDFSGALGTGTGKWRLTVTSEQPIRVMSLLENRVTGHLTNLSTVAANQPWQWDR